MCTSRLELPRDKESRLRELHHEERNVCGRCFKPLSERTEDPVRGYKELNTADHTGTCVLSSGDGILRILLPIAEHNRPRHEYPRCHYLPDAIRVRRVNLILSYPNIVEHIDFILFLFSQWIEWSECSFWER